MRIVEPLSSVSLGLRGLEVRVAFYLVERYMPSLTAADLQAAIARIDALPRGRVRHLWTILVAGEDTCLSVFEGPDVEAVEEANARASFHLDRVVAITWVEAGKQQSGRRRDVRGPRMAGE